MNSLRSKYDFLLNNQNFDGFLELLNQISKEIADVRIEFGPEATLEARKFTCKYLGDLIDNFQRLRNNSIIKPDLSDETDN